MRWVDSIWFNAAWFQLGWFVCVLGRETWLPLGLLLLCLHFFWVDNARREIKRLLPVAALGVAVDTTLSLFGVFDFGPGVWVPAWMVVLWLIFAAAIYRCFARLASPVWLAAALGATGVPFNYVVGAGLGAVALPLPMTVTVIILMAIWSVLLPTLFRLARWIDARP